MSPFTLLLGTVIAGTTIAGMFSLWPRISLTNKPTQRVEPVRDSASQRPPTFPGKTTNFDSVPKPSTVLSNKQSNVRPAPFVVSGNTEFYGDARDFTASTSQPSEANTGQRQESVAQAIQPLLNNLPYGGETAPVKELISYLDALKSGKAAFSWNMSGEEAAKQLGFTRLFASAYDELALQVRSKLKSDGVHISEVQNAFEHLLRQERFVDKLLREKDARHAASIAYLRALQNGDVVFPGPQPVAPSPQIVLLQLISANPQAKFPVDELTFSAVYARTREFAADHLKQHGEVSISEIIATLRQNIIASVAAGPLPEQSCEKAKALGQLAALPQFCSNLRLSETLNSELAKAGSSKSTAECRERSEISAINLLKSLDRHSIDKDCGLLERGVRDGQILVYTMQTNQQ